jgi:murein DD-endopeptidase MepM/ murein hydrolase activator NlpD
MLLLESSETAGKHCPVQVFASDVSEDALEAARTGAYPETVAANIPADRLKQFFTRQGQTYRVNKSLRDAVVFSRQNLLIDPPFSKLDLISCRNVLIYLEPEAQKKVLSMFSFALNAGGYLLLGKSEGITGVEDLFEPVSKQKRIYRSKTAKRMTAFPLYGNRATAEVGPRNAVQPAAVSLTQANQAALLKHFNASIVLVDPQGQILHFFGQTEKYLGHPTGPASMNILDMTAGTLSEGSQITPPAMRFTPLAGFTLGREPLVMPVEGARAADLRDSFEEARGSTRRHEAIDIPAPRGTPVVAAVDGSIEKLFTSEQGGLTVYEFDRDRGYCYYYAHLDRYAEDVREKKLVRRGDRLGYVGTTGDASAEAPHLHFAIFRLGPAKQWWVGTPINPYPFLLGTR